MMFLAIGVIIGFVMGLTGAGGALVAIPLFMQFLGMSLKDASVYSLVAVVIASLSHFYYQRKEARPVLAAMFVGSSSLGSFLSSPYKNVLPDKGIAIALTLIALYSLYSVWVPPGRFDRPGEARLYPVKTIILGLLLGVLTTFTGLGGGVLMLPILLGFYRLPETQAVATSLVVVGLSSLASFLIQIFKGGGLKLDGSFVSLLLGILITSFLLKKFTSQMPLRRLSSLRKIVFTIVVGVAVAKIF